MHNYPLLAPLSISNSTKCVEPFSSFACRVEYNPSLRREPFHSAKGVKNLRQLRKRPDVFNNTKLRIDTDTTLRAERQLSLLSSRSWLSVYLKRKYLRPECHTHLQDNALLHIIKNTGLLKQVYLDANRRCYPQQRHCPQ